MAFELEVVYLQKYPQFYKKKLNFEINFSFNSKIFNEWEDVVNKQNINI